MVKKLRYLLLLFFTATFFNACTDDNPADPNVPGSDRDKFVGSWLCKETITGSGPVAFTISIQKHGVEDTLYVYNFNNLGAQDFAIWLISNNSVVIPQQTISQVNIAGSGFYTNNEINLTYSSDSDQVTAICTQ